MEELEEFLKMQILEQMFKLRKLPYEQFVGKTNKEINEIEENINKKQKELTNFLKKLIKNKKNYDEANIIINDYEIEYSKQIDFWGNTFYKLGVIDGYKLKRTLRTGIEDLREDKTFIEYSDAELEDYIEHKRDCSTNKYKELKNKYVEISEKYPKVASVYEDLEPIVLNENEMKIFVRLRELDVEMKELENKLCFKLGMNEILNF